MPPARRKGSALGSNSSTDRPAADVLVGRLGKPNGLEGFLGVYVEPEDLVHLEPGSEVVVLDRIYTVRARRQGKKGPQVAFEEVTDRHGAEEIRGSDVFVAAARELTENEFWPSDLVGLEVRPAGGRIVGVAHGASQDRLVVERDSRRFEVPFVDALVPVVDVESGYVELDEIEGLSSLSDQQ